MKVTRRDVLKTAAAASAMAAIGAPLTQVANAAANEPDEWVKSVCRFCGTGCGVMVGVKGGKVRSEERRVGTECRIGCRFRWSPYH